MTFLFHRRELTAGIALLAIGAFVLAVRVDGAFQTSRPDAAFGDRLNIASLYIEALDAPYNEEMARLEELCLNRTEIRQCRERNLRSASVKAGTVHSAPSATSPILGDLYAVLTFHLRYDLGYRLEFRPGVPRAPTRVWLESIGDWGYGIEIDGVRVQGRWIQLIDPSLPATSWIDGTKFRASVGSIEGSLVGLPAIPATGPDGMLGRLRPGSYLVERIHGAELIVREEVPSDFPCGEDVKPPAVMPPSMRIVAGNLFGSSGEALFGETYGRGC